MLLSDVLRVVFGLVAVIGMIGLVALAAKKFGLAQMSGGLVRQRRLALTETLALDARRRLVIVKCDDREHLIILGQNSETLIESVAAIAAAPAEKRTAQPENPFPTVAEFARRFAPKKDAAA